MDYPWLYLIEFISTEHPVIIYIFFVIFHQNIQEYLEGDLY